MENFRAFKEGVEISNLGKINVIAGPNNVGKSSLLMPLRRLTRIDDEFVPLIGGPDGAMSFGALHSVKFHKSDFRKNGFPEIRLSVEIDSLLYILQKAISDYRGLDSIGPLPDVKRLDISMSSGADGGFVQLQVASSFDSIFERKSVITKELENSILSSVAMEVARSVARSVICVPALRRVGNAFSKPDATQHQERRYDGESLLSDLLAWYLPSLASGDTPNYQKIAKLNDELSAIFDSAVKIWPTSEGEVRISIGSKMGESIFDVGDGVSQIVIIAAAVLSMHRRPILILEEPEICMHPTLQRRLAEFLLRQDAQVMISTHSNHLIDCLMDEANLYVLSCHSIDAKHEIISIHSDALRAYSELGVSASSIAASVATLWVEGPSDAIYLRYWMSIYAPTSVFREGRHFSFAFHAGSLLAHVGLDGEEIVKLMCVHPSCFLVVDSDRKRHGGELAHPYLQKLLLDDRLAERIWITEPKEIEGYIPDRALAGDEGDPQPENASTGFEPLKDRLELLGISSASVNKVKLARKAIAAMRQMPVSHLLEMHDLKEQLDRIANFIRHCRGNVPWAGNRGGSAAPI